MRCRDLRLIIFNKQLIGMEGDVFVHYTLDPESNVVLGISPQLFLTLQAATVNELFQVAHKYVEDLLEQIGKEQNVERWALEQKVEVRWIVNFLYFKKRRPKMPTLIFIEEERLDDLERNVRQ